MTQSAEREALVRDKYCFGEYQTYDGTIWVKRDHVDATLAALLSATPGDEPINRIAVTNLLDRAHGALRCIDAGDPIKAIPAKDLETVSDAISASEVFCQERRLALSEFGVPVHPNPPPAPTDEAADRELLDDAKLHEIFRQTINDPAVKPHQLIYEFARRVAALSRKSRVAVDRDAVIEECAKAMDTQRIAFELNEIQLAKQRDSLGVRYNPEQKMWKKAGAILRALKSAAPQPSKPYPVEPQSQEKLFMIVIIQDTKGREIFRFDPENGDPPVSSDSLREVLQQALAGLPPQPAKEGK